MTFNKIAVSQRSSMLNTPTRKMVIKPLANKEVQNVVMPHLHEGKFSVTVLLRNSRSKKCSA